MFKTEKLRHASRWEDSPSDRDDNAATCIKGCLQKKTIVTLHTFKIQEN